MIRTIRHHFKNPQQAEGFIEGVEWVNDSSLEYIDTIDGEDPGGNLETVVTYTDKDGEPENIDLDFYHRVDP